MKKTLLTGASLLAVALGVQAFTTSFTLAPNSSTNLIPQSARVTQVIVSSTTGTNTLSTLYDSPTNGITFVQAGYTNTITVGTNFFTLYTNFFGVVNTNYYTNAIVDITNNAVAATTNIYPVRIGPIAAAASTSYKIDQVNYYFINGVMATNNSSGQQSVTITWFNN